MTENRQLGATVTLENSPDGNGPPSKLSIFVFDPDGNRFDLTTKGILEVIGRDDAGYRGNGPSSQIELESHA